MGQYTTHTPPDLLFEQLGLITQSEGAGFTLPQQLRHVADLGVSQLQLLVHLAVVKLQFRVLAGQISSAHAQKSLKTEARAVH